MRKILSLVLAMCVSISCFAGVAKALHLEEMMQSVVQPVLGNQADTLEDVFNGETYESSAVLSDYQVTNDGEMLQIQGKIITAEGNTHHFNVGGNLHEFVNGENKTVYLAEIEDTISLHFVQARIDSENSSYLKLLVQDKSNEEFMYFEVPVSNMVIPQSYALNSTTVGDSEIAERLYYVAGNIISPNNSEMTVTVSENGDAEVIITENGVQLPQPRATYHTTVDNDIWLAFFNGIANGGTYVNTYAIDSRILNSGWVFLHNVDAFSGKYTIASYATSNGTNSKIIKIMYWSVMPDTVSSTAPSINFDCVHHYTLEYNSATGQVSPYMVNFGLGIKELELKLSIVHNSSTNRTVFKSREVNANSNGTPNILSALVAYVPKANIAYDVWSYAQDEDISINQLDRFEPTYEQQLTEYGAKIVRGISVNTESNIFDSSADYLDLTGELCNGVSNCTTWEFSYTGVTMDWE